MNVYEKPDFYSKKALKEGYAARSVYKLMEIQEKFKIMKKGDKILDLGCAPGSWCQYASKIVGEKGLIVGIDYKEIRVALSNAVFVHGNFLREHKKEEIQEYAPFNGIISDMAPDTKGDRLTDCYASSNLVEEALNFSYKFLKKGGYFIAKIFQGGDENVIMDELKQAFKTTKWFKPKSCRKKSFEIFMVASGFIKKPEKQEEPDIFDDDNYTGEMPW